MEASNILNAVQADLDGAIGTHNEVMAQMEANYAMYAGEQADLLERQDATSAKWLSSGFKLKDVKRMVEGSLPDLVDPFVSTDKIVGIDTSNGDVEFAEMVEDEINKQFTKSQDKLEFMETIAKDVQVDGTCFTKVGWGDDQAVVENIAAAELILDPSARRMKDLRFAIQRRKVMFDEIVNNSLWFGEHSADDLRVLEATTETEYDRQREQQYGRDDAFNFEDRARQLIEVFEYYGLMDIGNGLEPVLVIWSDNMLLRATGSPYQPEWNGIPFESAVYSRNSHTIYGQGLPEMMADYVNLRDKLMRGIINNMDRSTNGQKFVKKGGMDTLSFKKMLDGSPVVWTNKDPREVIMDGTYNEIPSSVFGLMEGMKTEQEELSGIGRLNNGLDPRALNSGTSATAANIVNTNAQKRLLQITRHMSEMLERVMYKYVELNMMMRGGDTDMKFDATIVVGTSGRNSEKLNNIRMMQGQLAGLGDVVPPKVHLALVKDMSELLDMPELSKALSESIEMIEQPNPMAEMGMQVEMAEKQAAIAKDNSQAKKNEADAMYKFVETERMSFTPIGGE